MVQILVAETRTILLMVEVDGEGFEEPIPSDPVTIEVVQVRATWRDEHCLRPRGGLRRHVRGDTKEAVNPRRRFEGPRGVVGAAAELESKELQVGKAQVAKRSRRIGLAIAET